MGNIIGNMINEPTQNNTREQDISSTIPYLRKLNADAKHLINNLDVPTANITHFTETDNYDMYKIFEQNKVDTNDFNATFSDTSPFISSDLYNNLVKQSGGGEGEGEGEDDDSSTSSSSNELEPSNPLEQEMEDAEEMSARGDDNDISEGLLSVNSASYSNGSYVSSSAHTDGIASSSSNVTTISIGNNKVLSDSVNTSDINMISIEE